MRAIREGRHQIPEGRQRWRSDVWAGGQNQNRDQYRLSLPSKSQAQHPRPPHLRPIADVSLFCITFPAGASYVIPWEAALAAGEIRSLLGFFLWREREQSDIAGTGSTYLSRDRLLLTSAASKASFWNTNTSVPLQRPCRVILKISNNPIRSAGNEKKRRWWRMMAVLHFACRDKHTRLRRLGLKCWQWGQSILLETSVKTVIKNN